MQETSTSKKTSTPNRHLRGERELRGWTREYVAERIGSDSKSVARWERGATFPHPYYRQKLCELFERNAIELGFVSEEDSAVAEQPPTLQPEAQANQEAKLYVRADQVVFENLPAPPFPPGLRRLLIILIICGILVTGSILTLTVYTARGAAPPSSPSRIRPGGVWVNPTNGQHMRGIIQFAAQAYPTNHGDPAIDHVNFTVHWTDGTPGTGNWQVACIATTSSAVSNMFSCNFDPASLNIPAGPIKVSFDVYDVNGNVNFSPEGEHTITYVP